jgi:hypothetical protein
VGPSITEMVSTHTSIGGHLLGALQVSLAGALGTGLGRWHARVSLTLRSTRGALPERLLDLAALQGEHPCVGGTAGETGTGVLNQAELGETRKQL